MIVNDFFAAFRAGKELSNAATWKKAQVATAKLTVLLGASVAIFSKVFDYDLNLTPSDIATIAGAIVIVIGMFNGTATVVSTTRVGLSPRGGSVVPSGADGVRGDSPGEPDHAAVDRPSGLDNEPESDVFDMRYKG